MMPTLISTLDQFIGATEDPEVFNPVRGVAHVGESLTLEHFGMCDWYGLTSNVHEVKVE